MAISKWSIGQLNLVIIIDTKIGRCLNLKIIPISSKIFATDARKKHSTRIDIPCIRGKKIETETLPKIEVLKGPGRKENRN